MKIYATSLFALLLAACAPSPQNTPSPSEKPNPPAAKFAIGDFTPQPIGNAFQGRPWITDLCIVDLDKDGLPDILLCEGRANQVSWVRQTEIGAFQESVVGDQIQGPAHVEAADIDADGDLDILVASMGVIFPSIQKIGAVIILEQTSPGSFKKRTLLENVDRVTDIRAADIDGDGDLDLSVAQFGYDQGELRWMENLGDWNFKSISLLRLSGAIHAPIADFDLDGDLDIAGLFSQEWEEIHVFENQGNKTFNKRSVYGSANEDYGSSGISIADINQDGRIDILYTNGDAFDYAAPGPRPWHGVQWLENKANGQFLFHRLGDFPGAYSPIATDLDNDGDQDIVAVSGFNRWDRSSAISLIYFENDGQQNFTPSPLAKQPTHLIVVKAADMDNDGDIELVTGSFHAYPPYDRLARLTLWDR